MEPDNMQKKTIVVWTSTSFCLLKLLPKDLCKDMEKINWKTKNNMAYPNPE